MDDEKANYQLAIAEKSKHDEEGAKTPSVELSTKDAVVDTTTATATATTPHLVAVDACVAADPASPWYRRVWQKTIPDAFYREALSKYSDGLSPEDNRRLVRKLDWTIIPILSMCYCFYYVDKTTLSYAAIFNMRQDLGLNGDMYSWLSSCFYLGWFVWALPANIMLQKSPVGKYLGLNIMLWGIFLMAQGAVDGFVPLLVLRIIGGAVESIADPCFLVITGMFYTLREQPLRIGYWYLANGVGTSVGGLLGYAIGNIESTIASWRLIFIIVGACCTGWGMVIFGFCPDNPTKILGFSREDKLMLIARVKDNQTGIENKTLKWDQVREAVLDVKTWIYFLIAFVSNAPNGVISNFGTIIIKGMGFSTLNTTLLQIPYGAIVIIWISSAIFLNEKLPGQTRLLICAAYMVPTAAGALGFLLAPSEAHIGRLWCYYLTSSFQAPYVLYLSVITSSVAGHTKKILTISASFLGFCIGNVVGPFFMKDSEAPEYQSGIIGILVCNVSEALLFLALRMLFVRANRNKERELEHKRENGIAMVSPEETAFADLTDKQNPYFRYSY